MPRTAQTGRKQVAIQMASRTILAAVLAAIAALLMFVSGELFCKSPQEWATRGESTCCRQAGQGALCGTAFQVSHKQDCDYFLGL